MANPWDADEIVRPAATAGGNPWDQDEIIKPANEGLEIDIIGGTPEAPKPAKPTPNASLFRMDSDFGKRSGVGGVQMFTAAAKDMFGSRKGAAEYLVKKINENRGLSSMIDGGAKVDVGPDGEPVIALADGTTYRLNDAGLDSTDVANVGGNVAAFLTPAGWAARLGQARNVGLAGRAALQAGTAATTDAALQATFNDGNVDGGRVALAGAGGAGGEVFGTALGAGLSKIGQLTRGAGANSRAAEALAGNAGMKPTPSQLNRLSGGMEEIRAGADPRAILGREEFGLQYTQGQRMADGPQQFAQRSREEVLRQSPGSGEVLRAAERGNADTLQTVLGDMGERMGGRVGATPAELAQGAASRVSQQADDLNTRVGQAYDAASKNGRTSVAASAIQALPDRLRAAVRDFAPNPTTTPVTAKTLEQIAGAAKVVAGGNVKGVTLKALETQRRIINNNIGAATNRTDRAALMTIKREFDGWMDDAFDSSLVTGDKAALDAIKEARGLRSEFGRRFEGGSDSDRFIGGLLDGTRTPEELVNLALGASQISKAGGARFIERLRVAADGDPEVIGNLRGAHFLRMTRGNNGEPLNMGQIVRNIRSTEYNNASVVRALYDPAEWAEIRRLANALDPLVAKGDFGRTSGSAERVWRMMASRIGGGLPVIGEVVQAVGSVRNTAQAQKALSRPLRLPSASPAGVQGGGAALLTGSGRD